jgi:transcriptional regulator with XRE-family HTH domain
MVRPVLAVNTVAWNRQSEKTANGENGMSLGARITKLRLKAGESLQEVANAVGVSKAHIWELEKGRADNPSMGLVTRLADHFGVSVASLAGEDPRASDANPKLAGMFRQASKLGEKDLAVLEDMLQSLLKHRARKS